MDMAIFRRRPYLLVILAFLSVLWFFSPTTSSSIRRSPGPSKYPRTIHSTEGDFVELDALSLPQKLGQVQHNEDIKLRVAVLEHAGFHDEVIGAVLKTLDDIGANYTVYRDSWRWGFEQILLPFLPYLPKPTPRGLFKKDEADAGRFDVSIHISCDHRWRDRMPNWIAETLDQVQDLHVICIQHELEALKPIERETWMGATEVERFEMMTLSSHTTRELGRVMEKWAQETKDVNWAKVGVQTLVPIFPVDPEKIAWQETSTVHPPLPRPKGHHPSRIAILGNIQMFRRNYQGMIWDLHRAIMADPAAWGYEKPTSKDEPLVPANNPAIPPITLHFVGSLPGNSHLRIPDVFKNLVNIHSDLEYDDFYRLIASMDLIVPAFIDFVYVDLKLSSAIPAAIISRVPILGTPLLLESYAFLRPPAIILHPSGITEIEAIRLLRLGQNPMSLVPEHPSLLPNYPNWGGDQGIFGSKEEWDAYHTVLYDHNAGMMRNLLGGIERKRRERGWSVGGEKSKR